MTRLRRSSIPKSPGRFLTSAPVTGKGHVVPAIESLGLSVIAFGTGLSRLPLVFSVSRRTRARPDRFLVVPQQTS
jgi:hypothetical protein